MRNWLRSGVVWVLCLTSPALAYAGPLRDALRDASVQQAAQTASKSRQRLWVGGLTLTIVGGALALFGADQTKRSDDPMCGVGYFSSCDVSDPNVALIGAGSAMVGVGVVMIILGRDRPAPQIVVTPSKMSVQHTWKF